MANAETYSAGGDKTGTVDLPDGVFGIEPNAHVVWISSLWKEMPEHVEMADGVVEIGRGYR